jgi:glutathione S-transferase
VGAAHRGVCAAVVPGCSCTRKRDILCETASEKATSAHSSPSQLECRRGNRIGGSGGQSVFELHGLNGRYSLFSWRTRMALRHKGLEFESVPVRMSDKAAIAFSGGKTVPIIKDGDTVVRDSWKIAEHLESRYPDAPPLFGGEIGRGVSAAFNIWVDRAVVPAMLPVIAADVHERVDPDDESYFRKTMEKVLKMTLEESRARRDAAVLQGLGRCRTRSSARRSWGARSPRTPTTSCSRCSSGRA